MGGRYRCGGGEARCHPQIEIGFKVIGQVAELLEVEGLRAVAVSLFGGRMHFNEQAVCSDGHRSARQRRHQAALARGVAGIAGE